MTKPQQRRVLRARAPPVDDSLSNKKPNKRKTVPDSQPNGDGVTHKKVKQSQTDLKIPKRSGKQGQGQQSKEEHPNSAAVLPKTHSRKTSKHKSDNNTQSTDKLASNPSHLEDKTYWLMKAEQEDREVQVKSGATINTKFTIEDLKARGKPEPWDGVRNVVARNNMRSMKLGDLAFFYASGGKGKNKPGITGIMTVVKEHEPDWTMYDESAYGYVEPDQRGPDKEPKWSLVHVDFKEQLTTPVTLAELRAESQPGHPLADMQLLRNGRISVSKVTAAEWKFITEELIHST